MRNTFCENGIEEDYTSSSGGTTTVDLTRLGVGPRGLEWQDKWQKVGSGSWTFVTSSELYPIYDTHGNNVGMLDRSGSLGMERAYDAWGNATYSAGGEPPQGYCASLGHRADAESGLVYMRARFYEPWTGRFVSEDPARDGFNWLTYCGNDPVNMVDPTGKTQTLDDVIYIFGWSLRKMGLAMFWAGAGMVGVGLLAATILPMSVMAGVAASIVPSISGSIFGGAALMSLGLVCTFLGNLYMALRSDADDWMKNALDWQSFSEDEINKRLGGR